MLKRIVAEAGSFSSSYADLRQNGRISFPISNTDTGITTSSCGDKNEFGKSFNISNKFCKGHSSSCAGDFNDFMSKST
jgi:hypothetical protein